MLTLFFVGLITLLTYTGFTIYKCGISNSFSYTFYCLKNLGWLFTINMFILTFTLTPVILSITENQWWQFISFFTITPIAFVGVASAYKGGELIYKIHMFAAGMSAVASLIWVILVSIYIVSNMWLVIPFSIIIMSLCYILDKRKNIIWWAEFACFMWMLLAIYILI